MAKPYRRSRTKPPGTSCPEALEKAGASDDGACLLITHRSFEPKQRRRIFPGHDVEFLISKSLFAHRVDEDGKAFGRQCVRFLAEIGRHDDRRGTHAANLLGKP